jgi:hypothetical protein
LALLCAITLLPLRPAETAQSASTVFTVLRPPAPPTRAAATADAPWCDVVGAWCIERGQSASFQQPLPICIPGDEVCLGSVFWTVLASPSWLTVTFAPNPVIVTETSQVPPTVTLAVAASAVPGASGNVTYGCAIDGWPCGNTITFPVQVRPEDVCAAPATAPAVNATAAVTATQRGQATTRVIQAADLPVRIRDARTGTTYSDGAAVPVVLGQRVELTVRCGESSVDTAVWSIGNVADPKVADPVAAARLAVKGYVLDNNSIPPQLTKLASSDLTQTQVGFNFFRTGVHAVNVHATSNTSQGPMEGDASVYFVVVAPSVTARSITTCQVALNSQKRFTPTNKPLNPPSVGLGLNDACGKYPVGDPGVPDELEGKDVPGIYWDFTVSADTRIGGGAIGMVQSITNVVKRDGRSCANQTTPGADHSNFYDGYLEPLAPSGQTMTARWRRSDSPGIGLALTGLWGVFSKQFRAVDYLMFKSDKPDSIWVQLGYVPVWSLSFTATSSPGLPLNRVVLNSASSPATSLQLLPGLAPNATSLPVWDRVHASGTPLILC